MAGLGQCFEAAPPAACAESRASGGFAEEVLDIQSYHALLLAGSGSEAALSPFATSVILHNLVSESVDEQFRRPGAPRFYCVADAVANIDASLRGTGEPRLPRLPPGVRLPGVGPHRLVDCPG